MLDSWQTSQVGYYTGEGEWIHEDCGDGKLVTLRAERLMAVDSYRPWYACVSEAIEQLSERLRLGEGFSAESRYGIHEAEASMCECDEPDEDCCLVTCYVCNERIT